MKFRLWREYGAQNSVPVFDALQHSIAKSGLKVINSNNLDDADVHVIWSVLWNGRMSPNQRIWQHCKKHNKPIIVLEIGGIQRGKTWRVGLNGINRDAYFSDSGNDNSRANLLGLELSPWRKQGKYILIFGQHEKSEQWTNMPRMSQWVINTIDSIQKHTDRPILFRPHPRCPLPHIENEFKNVYRQTPRPVAGTYDDFDHSFDNIHAVVNVCSNPGPQAAIAGYPVFVSPSSLAYDVGNDIDFFHDIENPMMPDRQQWLNDYAHTEHTVEEIAEGIPLKHLTSKLF